MRRKINEKIIKLICCALICLVFASLLNVKTANAAVNKPSSVWSLKYISNGGKGKYSGSGNCNTVDLYSNYYYTGVPRMKITVTNKSSEKTVRVKVYKDAFLDSCVSSVTVPKNGKTTWTIETDKTAKYYLKFLCPAEFTWSIKRG